MHERVCYVTGVRVRLGFRSDKCVYRGGLWVPGMIGVERVENEGLLSGGHIFSQTSFGYTNYSHVNRPALLMEKQTLDRGRCFQWSFLFMK